MTLALWQRAGRSIAVAVLLAMTPLVAANAAPAKPEPVADWTGRDPAAEQGPGASIYAENCAACHDAGVNRAPQRFVLGDMTPQAIHKALTDGAMREQGAALSAEQRLAVAEFVAGRRISPGDASAGLAMCRGRAARFDLREPPAFSGWGLDPASTHSIPSKVSGLNAAKARNLKLKWAFGFPNSSRARSHPTLAGGAVLVGNHNGSVYALDRASGCLRWAFAAQAEVRTGIVVSPWRAGDRKARPLVYFGDVMGNAYAVDLLTGQEVWKVRADNHPATILTGTPSLHAGVLYVPVSSSEEAFATSPAYACCDFRGSVLALDAATGREKWRTWLVDPAVNQGVSKDGPDKLGPSGVAVWNSPSIDVRRGQLVVATGDNYSLPATGLSDAIVALDLATGRVKWHYQALANDAWNVACVTKTSASCPDEDAPDFDFGAGAVLAAGKDGRELVLAGQKSGWVYGLDPDSGKLVWKTRVGRGSPIGGVHFGMAADAGMLFVPVSDRVVTGPDDFAPSPGLHALDIANGTLVWKAPSPDVCGTRPLCSHGYGGALSATAGLVLIGGDDGHLRIYDARTGLVIKDEDTARPYATVNGVPGRGGAISGGVAPIAYKGQVIVASGYGYASKMTGNVLLVYGTD